MFSKILIKLVDQSIMPAILLVAVRIISIIAFSKYFGLYVDLDQTGFIISRTPNGQITLPEDFILINSFSTITMIGVLAVVLMYIIFKFFVLHDTHITPGLTAQMFSARLSSFIQNSFDLYSQGAIWVSYLYLLVVVAGIMAVFEIIYPWVFLSGFFLTIIVTTLFVIDVEYEMKLKKETYANKYEDEEVIVKIQAHQ